MRLLSYCLILVSIISFSQTNSEIHLLEIAVTSNKVQVLNSKIISSSIGYHNQPSFTNNNKLLFSSERDKQNDIVEYNIKNNDNKLKFITSTFGSEYSPIQYKKNKVTAVSLDKNGVQYLRIYDIKKNTFKIPFKDKVVGYYNHSKETKDLIVSSVLENNELVLYSSNLKTREHVFIDSNTGRSIHPIPNNKFGEEKFSYISKKDSVWTINYVNLSNYKTEIITNTLENNEDICLLKNGTILTSKGNKLYIVNPTTDSKWVLLCSLEDFGITNISRMSINPNNDKLALVNSK
tara:strand:+ start:477 stop:1352 length:876 start_codon:yes stop_codon:yes gene_type:complete